MLLKVGRRDSGARYPVPRAGKYDVTGEELKLLREGLAQTMDYLRGVPNVPIAHAVMAVDGKFNKTEPLRV